LCTAIIYTEGLALTAVQTPAKITVHCAIQGASSKGPYLLLYSKAVSKWKLN